MATRSIAGDILDLVGITGAGVATSSLAPRTTGQTGQAAAVRDFADAGQVSNPEVWSYYNTAMRQPASFDEMLRLWEDMSTWDLLAAALVEVVDEVIQPDSNAKGSLWYECNDAKQEEALNDMLLRIDAETILPSQVWHVAAFGNHFERLLYAKGAGIQALSFVHPMDIRRFWLAKSRKCVGFRWNAMRPDREDLYKVGNQVVPRNTISLSQGNNSASQEDLWYPWDFLHRRRMYRLRISEHGEPIFNEAQGIYKKLRIALDQMVVHRAQVQPDRYVVNVDVGEQPPADQMRTVHRWRQSMRSKLAFGQGQNSTSTPQVDDFKSYYNALALDTIFWMAKPKNFGSTIEKLTGTANVPDVYDIELLTNLFFSAMRMPKSWLGIGDTTNGPQSGKALLVCPQACPA